MCDARVASSARFARYMQATSYIASRKCENATFARFIFVGERKIVFFELICTNACVQNSCDCLFLFDMRRTYVICIISMHVSLGQLIAHNVSRFFICMRAVRACARAARLNTTNYPITHYVRATHDDEIIDCEYARVCFYNNIVPYSLSYIYIILPVVSFFPLSLSFVSS